MRKQLGYTSYRVIWAIVMLLGTIGWVWNVLKILQHSGEFGIVIVLRIIGIFAVPLGSIMGFM